MRNPIVPALICLAALGCSHRHLILAQAPLGSRAMADQISTGWRITLVVQGAGWEVSSPEELIVFERKDVGDRTRISWDVSKHRWAEDRPYQLSLKNGDQELVLVIQNRSQEGQVAEGVVVGVVVVGMVALAVASMHSKGSGPKGPTSPRPTGPGGRPAGPWGRPVGPGGHPTHVPAPALQIQIPVGGPPIQTEVVAAPLVSVESFGDGAFPGPLSAALRPVPQGWEVEVELRSLPEGDTWTVAGEGFEANVTRAGRDLVVRWMVGETALEDGQSFDLTFQGPGRICRARVRVQ